MGKDLFKKMGLGLLTIILASLILLPHAFGDVALAFGGFGGGGFGGKKNDQCQRTLFADVVIFDQPIMYNRLGAQNVNGLMYALRRDVVARDTNLTESAGGTLLPGLVALRPDKRPRPLVLRVREGDCLEVDFQNLLDPGDNPFAPPEERSTMPFTLVKDDQVAERFAGFHVTGAQWVNGELDDGSHVGENLTSLVPVGGKKIYKLFFEKEGQFVLNNYGVTFGGEGQGGNTAGGAFGMVAVEPKDSAFYRSQINRDEMNLVRSGRVSGAGPADRRHPIISYEASYPEAEPYISEGKAKLPVLNMICRSDVFLAGGTIRMCRKNEIVHNDISAIIGYGPSGKLAKPMTGPHMTKLGHFPAETYPLESKGKRNPTVPNRLEPFREFASLFHDEVVTAQMVPGWFEHPVLSHTLHGVRDSFMINYGSAGIGAEIIANRLGVGPMYDCLNCSYEEFFLSSSTVGDPAQLVDVPANVGLEDCKPDFSGCGDVGPKANFVLFPDDPSNVHHSYTNDFVKFRNVHAGPAEQHIFHLHNHQWLFNANNDNSNYIDAQGLGPGAGYTYEINFGGSGNRNKTSGDAIFHCHFYPHFAQGMWHLWRVHDVLEEGTVLAKMGGDANSFGDYTPYTVDDLGLGDGTPRNLFIDSEKRFETVPDTNRALPDGEIVVGTAIPGLLPLPGKPMAPMPGLVKIVSKNADDSPTDEAEFHRGQDSSQVSVVERDVNPGFPLWIGSLEHTTGQRPVTPPLDMISKAQATALAGTDPAGLWDHPGLVAGAGGWDGGLPRSTVDGYLAGGISKEVQNRFDFSKDVFVAKAHFFPEEGTDVEQTHMRFQSKRCHDSFYPESGSSASCSGFDVNGDTLPDFGGFIVNGQPPVPGAPFNEPCIDDNGTLMVDGFGGSFFSGDVWTGMSTFGRSKFSADKPRVYRATALQIDAVFNKQGYHFPQERLFTLWEDVIPTIEKRRPPEPFVLRLNTFDCSAYHLANLVPKVYELDDYQVRTPTDIIGQHIHLPKWDLVSADGSANGWNYEDGTYSPEKVVEMIEAINAFNADPGNSPVLTDVEGNPVISADGHSLTATGTLEASIHPFFKPTHDTRWLGTRTTTQRWFADPVVNVEGVDRGLGIIFTHDHFDPSTHQQVGLYATVLTEPAGSVWKHNETGVVLGDIAPGSNPAGRDDGGPTSWQAAIITEANGLTSVQPESVEDFREFFFDIADFQHAYEPGVYVGIGSDGLPITPHDILSPWDEGNLPAVSGAPSIKESFRFALQPPIRDGEDFPDILISAPKCPGGVDRPCAEAITADDAGMFIVNYRNESLLSRVFDPLKIGPDGKPGAQADGKAGDLGFALQSRTDRKIAALNSILGVAPGVYAGAGTFPSHTGAGTSMPVFLPPVTQLTALDSGDPFTPMMRTYSGDRVHVKVQTGATEEEHASTLFGLKWLQGGSGQGKDGNSGWRNSQTSGISEQFTLQTPVNVKPGQLTNCTPGDPLTRGKCKNPKTADYAYSHDSSVDGWVQGVWGLIRNYTKKRSDLFALPDNPKPAAEVDNTFEFAKFADGFSVCPVLAPIRPYDITAVLANDVLPNPGADVTLVKSGFDPIGGLHAGGSLDPDGGSLVYNSRRTVFGPGKMGPLHDPTAILYVHTSDLGPDGKLKAGVAIEPVVLRAEAGDCIEVTLRNHLPDDMPDLPNRNTLQLTNIRDRNLGEPAEGVTWFGNNHIRPSSQAGLHPSLVEYDISKADGNNVGLNPESTVGPGEAKTVYWYAGHLEPVKGVFSSLRLVPTPIEFAGFNITPADKIKQHQKGMVAAGVVYADGSAWTVDPGTHTSATVSKLGKSFRDFTTVWQKNLNFYIGDGDSLFNTEAEGHGITEDPEDAGHMAITYSTEPAWFRFGIEPCGEGACESIADARKLYTNALVGGDPETPVFTAAPGEAFRMHLLLPEGSGRKSAPSLHGHAFQRDPYVCSTSAHGGLSGKCMPSEIGSKEIGDNPVGFSIGGFQSLVPGGHFEIVSESAGGVNANEGDYLFRDHMGLGNLDGLWGILRVEP